MDRLDKRKRFAKFIPPTKDFENQPFRVSWQVTGMANPEDRKGGLFDLTTDETAIVIEQVADLTQPYQFIIGAPDPFLRDDFTEILLYAFQKKLTPSVYLLDMAVTEERLKELRKLGVEELLITTTKPNNVLVNALLLAKENNFNTHLRYMITDENIRLTGIALQAAKDYRLDSFVLHLGEDPKHFQLINAADLEDLFGFLYCAMGDSDFYIETDVCPQYRRYIIERFMQERRDGMRPSLAEVFIPGVNLTFRGSSFVFKSPETFKNDSRLKVHGLTAGDGQLFIDSTGRIMPSRAYPTDGGTIRSNHLLTVYRNSTLFKQLRSRRFIEGKCKLCPYLFICGGSRERAWTFNENPNAEEPLCNFAYFMKTRRN